MTASQSIFRICLIALLSAIFIFITLIAPNSKVKASAATSLSNNQGIGMYWRPAPNYDLNLARKLNGARQATSAQLAALDHLRAATGAGNMVARWNDFSGSPDVIMDFASAPYAGTPEGAARAFIAANAALFGASSAGDLRLASEQEALGGHLLRFQQTSGGIDVKDGGIGIVMTDDKEVISAIGPFFRDVQVNTTPTLTREQARTKAEADLANFRVDIPSYVQNFLQPGLDLLSRQASVVENLEPKLGIYPAADG
ncbi:MAG TPA: hypothetical protein VID27_20025, partial [Blastocatellia bacterium]